MRAEGVSVSQLAYITEPRSQRPLRSPAPFLKWAGGKQQLLAQYQPYFPARMLRYFEPFVGGGAVFFHLCNTGRLPSAAWLFDNNAELINVYLVVRDKLDELIHALAEHQERHCLEHYYEVRTRDRQDIAQSDVERAARTVYLNKTCYNGLYRVNRRGQFNVPLGSYKDPAILRRDSLTAASTALRGACLGVRDFRSVVQLAQAGDFFYFDPPYDPLSKTASFTSYTAGGFREQDQRDLADVFTQLTAMGCLCMLSSSRTPLVLKLYRHFRIATVQANRAINSDAGARGAVREVVILNY